LSEILEAKQAAIEAKAATQQVYLAVRVGTLQAKREGNRVFIDRKSFEKWRKRLEAKRKIRREEVEVRAGV
jgi:hypothetical protein